VKYANINDSMQEGYKLFIEQKDAAACDVWIGTWKAIEEAMDAEKIRYIEDFDRQFDGDQYVWNWATDFDVALINASNQDLSYAQMRLDFFTAIYARTKQQNDEGALYMRRAVAEALYKLGRASDGDQVYAELTGDYPAWAWGWIGWSDQYGLFGEPGHQDFDKAIRILRDALMIPGLDDREDVLERLHGIYKEAGMTEEAEAVEQMIEAEKNGVPAVNAKVGRNDPCPCGSGKKYKKCHGA